MNKLLQTLLLSVLAVPAVASAADASPHTFTANAALVSNYLYRGISQTDNGAALQGGFDYSHASGFYAGVWGSNISWISGGGPATGSSSLEVDTYFGFKNSFADDFTYDVGFLRYNYPGNYTFPAASGLVKADTNEIYGALGWKWLTAKYSYSVGNTFGYANSKGSSYIDLSANYPIADTGFAVQAHVGRQTFKGFNTVANTANSFASYSDYKLGVTKDVNGYVFGLAYSKTNANAAAYTGTTGQVWSKGTAVLSLTRSF